MRLSSEQVRSSGFERKKTYFSNCKKPHCNLQASRKTISGCSSVSFCANVKPQIFHKAAAIVRVFLKSDHSKIFDQPHLN